MIFHLISFGFEPEKVFNMSFPYFYLSFTMSLKVSIRQRLISSSDFISSIGSFLVKKGEKTLVEDLAEQMLLIDEYIGDLEEEINNNFNVIKRKDPDKIMNDLFSQFSRARK